MGTATPQTNHRTQPGRVLLRNLVFLVFWVALFTLAYAQAPLYTSNQNQYFLHGFAQAGFGDLSADWLATTLDPTPVFSKWIEISWRVLPSPPVFYLYFGVLAGIFLFSLWGIADLLWGLGKSRPQKWLYLTGLIVLFSAGMRYLTARLLGINWEFLFDGGLAGQRLLGTVFQPSTFGVFLLLSIYLFLRGKRGWAILSLLVATTFHPTYLLSAGILTAVYMGLTFWETRAVRAPLALGLGALLGVSPILWHTLATFGGTAPDITTQARKILVEFRIPHHAVAAAWFDLSVLVKLGFVALALIILFSKSPTATSQRGRSTRQSLGHIILWPTVIALALTLLQVITDNVMLALLFPWRLSTWLVPLSVSLIVGWPIDTAFARFQLARYHHGIMVLSAITALVFTAIGIAKFQISWQARQALDDRAMMAYVATNKESGDVYLIPLKMQDFRLEAGAPAYVEFKSIPYQDVDVLEWRRRVKLVRDFNAQSRCKELIAMGQAEGITHLVLPANHDAWGCKQAESVYQDDAYGVYRIREP